MTRKITGCRRVGLVACCVFLLLAVLSAQPADSRQSRSLLQQAASVQAQQITNRRWMYALDNTYLNNTELSLWMVEYYRRCPGISRRFSIGKSAQGRQLMVLEISDNPGKIEPEPNFKYVANMHGDETGGRNMLLQLAEWLCSNYKTNSTAARIVRDMHLFILPTMNPDGFARSYGGSWRPGRENAQGIDLNRNFPDPQVLCQPDAANCDVSVLQRIPPGTAPEVAAVMQWSLPASYNRTKKAAHRKLRRLVLPVNLKQIHFTAAANLHEGAVVANYPFDGRPRLQRNAGNSSGGSSSVATEEGAAATSLSVPAQQQAGGGGAMAAVSVDDMPQSSAYTAAPDDKTFRWLAKTYSTHHAFMATSNPEAFEDGITNGADWYPVYGGMQDWNYLAGSCMDITLELNRQKNPDSRLLYQMWQDNKEALIALPIAAALGGIHGNVTDAATGAPLTATITLKGSPWRTYADNWFGFYTRPAHPGTYEILAEHPGYQPASATVEVPATDSVLDISPVVQNFQLNKL